MPLNGPLMSNHPERYFIVRVECRSNVSLLLNLKSELKIKFFIVFFAIFFIFSFKTIFSIDCNQHDKIIRLSSVLQKRLTKSYRRAVRKEAAKMIEAEKVAEKQEKDQLKQEKRDEVLKLKEEKQAERKSKKANKSTAQAERQATKL